MNDVTDLTNSQDSDKKRKSDQISTGGRKTFVWNDGKSIIIDYMDENQRGIWRQALTSLGHRLADRGSYFDSVKEVRGILATWYGVAPDSPKVVDVIMPYSKDELKAMSADKCKFNPKDQKGKLNIRHGTNGNFYETFKKEYEDQREREEELMADTPVQFRMAPFESIAQVWRDDLELNMRIWQCWPATTKARVFTYVNDICNRPLQEAAKAKASGSFEGGWHYRNDKDKIIDDAFHRAKMKHTAKELFDFLDTDPNFTQIPHPKWPNDRDKDTKFFSASSHQKEKTLVSLFSDFSAMRTSYFPSRKNVLELARKAALELTEDDEKAKGRYEKLREQELKFLNMDQFEHLIGWLCFLVPIGTNVLELMDVPSKEEQLALSRAHVDADEFVDNFVGADKPCKTFAEVQEAAFVIYDWIRRAPKQGAHIRFHWKEKWRDATWFRQTDDDKENLKKVMTPALVDKLPFKVQCPDVMGNPPCVWHEDPSYNAEAEKREKVFEWANRREVKREQYRQRMERDNGHYRWNLPKLAGIKEPDGVQTFCDMMFGDAESRDFFESDWLNRKDSDQGYLPYQDSDEYRKCDDALAVIQGFRKEIGSVDAFHDKFNSFALGPGKRPDKTTWKEFWKSVMTVMEAIKDGDENRDKLLKKLGQDNRKGPHYVPATKDKGFYYDPPGKIWAENAHTEMVQLFWFVDAMCSNPEYNPTPGLFQNQSQDDQCLKLMLHCLKFHNQLMGKSNKHYALSINSWMQPWFRMQILMYFPTFMYIAQDCVTDSGDWVPGKKGLLVEAVLKSTKETPKKTFVKRMLKSARVWWQKMDTVGLKTEGEKNPDPYFEEGHKVTIAGAFSQVLLATDPAAVGSSST